MAASLLTYKPSSPSIYHHTKSTQVSTARTQYPVTAIQGTTYKCFCSSHVAASSYISNHITPINGDKEEWEVEPVSIFKKWACFVHSALPGGAWWNLYECDEVKSAGDTVKPLSVWDFLRRLWGLVVDDIWILFIAFGSLVIAAVCILSNLLIAMFATTCLCFGLIAFCKKLDCLFFGC